ncbi:MAG: hypothetical protein FWE53_02885 [Firmicutes bacterium]|nr:hypothetical protein [Bacillota bacterium]
MEEKEETVPVAFAVQELKEDLDRLSKIPLMNAAGMQTQNVKLTGQMNPAGNIKQVSVKCPVGQFVFIFISGLASGNCEIQLSVNDKTILTESAVNPGFNVFSGAFLGRKDNILRIVGGFGGQSNVSISNLSVSVVGCGCRLEEQIA